MPLSRMLIVGRRTVPVMPPLQASRYTFAVNDCDAPVRFSPCFRNQNAGSPIGCADRVGALEVDVDDDDGAAVRSRLPLVQAAVIAMMTSATARPVIRTD